MVNSYEQGGVTGPNGTALLKSLQGTAVPRPGVEAPEAVPGAADLSQYARRGGSAGGSALGSAASGAMTGAGLASVVPGIGTALGAGIGGAIGGIKGLMNQHADSAPTDFNVNDAKSAIGQEYQHSLGRDASPQELMSQLSGQGWQSGDRYVGEKGLNSVLGSIGQSDEAKAFAAKGAAPAAAAPLAAPAAPAAAGGQTYKMEGFDAGKMADLTHDSPKYQIARAIQGFDPRQGVTPEVLAKLNTLGIGQFSGSGDKVTIANGDPRFEGVNAIDLVRGFKDPNSDGGWQFGAENTNAPQQAGGGTPRAMATAGGAGSDGYGLDPLLTGDPLAKIQAAISKQAGSGENIRALMNQLGNG
jgi:hypothetical protein